jgi:hypothetical protein
MSNVTALDTDQEDLAAYFEGLATMARQGNVIGVFGCLVIVDEEDCKVAPIEEGYTMSESDVMACLRYVIRELQESWEADLILSLPD